ncbi:39S ribosomal protein L15 mitochondrial [Fasciola hepatica]|uniref:Large ribosomal subunit protein uL15m n=1 Tax=Fasciola hepatica TaxID=6192 RepID=A0A2H1BXY3_FASHE|nr:39S ribosomal protein L15 mitochondrial [Fasciola hepatica]
MTSVDKALQLLRAYPRVCISNVKDLPRSIPAPYAGLRRKKRGLGHRGQSQYQAWRPLGDLGQKTPFYVSVPREPYNSDIAFVKPLYGLSYLFICRTRRSLARISLLELQRLIDLYRVDPNEPIDLTTLCNTGLYILDVEHGRHYGFQLTEEGIDDFVTPVNIEVQYASEPVIAAIERVGGSITTRFYDLFSVWAKQNPSEFFQKGIPIPSCKLPPVDAIPYYTSAESRGYLADPHEVEKARIWLSEKYGYRLVPVKPNLKRFEKDPRQIFVGLSPGSLVSLVDKVVFKPKVYDSGKT